VITGRSPVPEASSRASSESSSRRQRWSAVLRPADDIGIARPRDGDGEVIDPGLRRLNGRSGLPAVLSSGLSKMPCLTESAATAAPRRSSCSGSRSAGWPAAAASMARRARSVVRSFAPHGGQCADRRHAHDGERGHGLEQGDPPAIASWHGPAPFQGSTRSPPPNRSRATRTVSPYDAPSGPKVYCSRAEVVAIVSTALASSCPSVTAPEPNTPVVVGPVLAEPDRAPPSPWCCGRCKRARGLQQPTEAPRPFGAAAPAARNSPAAGSTSNAATAITASVIDISSRVKPARERFT